MDDNIVWLGAFGVFMVAVWTVWMRLFSLEMAKSREQSLLPDIATTLSNLSENIGFMSDGPHLDFDSIETKISDLVQDIIGESMENMQMPTATDHIMGALSNIIQHKMMNSIPQPVADMLPHLNEEVSSSDVHGPPSN